MEPNFSQLIEIPIKIYKSNVVYPNINEINNNIPLKKYIMKNYPNIKKGDIIHFESFGNHRNRGKYIFDGKKFVSLDYHIDDYGAIPPIFKIEEFGNLDYFSRSIPDNYVVHIDGNNYEIYLKIKTINKHYPYIYHIKHNILPFGWYILSQSPIQDFKKHLRRGTFASVIGLANDKIKSFGIESFDLNKTLIDIDDDF
jgi:hypothetical protein